MVLVAALMHAVWNVAAKKAGGDGKFVMIRAVLVAVLWAPVAIYAGLDEVPGYGPREWAVIVASGVVHVVYFNVLLWGYRVSDLTVVYPVARGTGPLLTAFLAGPFLGERLSPVAAFGVLAVCGGVFLVAGGPRMFARTLDQKQRARVIAGVRAGALTGAFISGYTLIDGYAVKELGISPIIIDYFGNLLRVPLMLPLVLRDRPAFVAAVRTQWKQGLIVATIGPLGYVLVLYAAKLAPLSHVAPAREVSMLFAALIGGKLLGEGDRALRFVGAACVAGGVASLALAR